MKFWKIVVLGIFVMGLTKPAFAEESQFAYVYTTDLLPKGKAEMEQWETYRFKRERGDFHVLESRTEFEYGITDFLQSAIYLNYNSTWDYHNNVDGTTAPPETFAGAKDLNPDGKFQDSKFVGVSFEGIWRLLSPYKDPIGLALYLEPTVGNRLFENEAKLLLQKNFFDDRLIIAVNGTIAHEDRNLPNEPETDPDTGDDIPVEGRHQDHEIDGNIGLAASYRFAKNWSVGFEFQNENEWAGFSMKPSHRTNTAFYLGPTVHYGGKRFFVTATFLAQLPWASDHANEAPGFIDTGRSNADDFEYYRVRIKTGVYFG